MLPDLQDQFCMLQNRIALLAHDPELFMLANSDTEAGEHAGVTVRERGLGGGVAGRRHCTCLDRGSSSIDLTGVTERVATAKPKHCILGRKAGLGAGARERAWARNATTRGRA